MVNVVSGDIGVVNARRSISEPRDAWEIFLRLICFHTLFTKRTKKIKNLSAKLLLRGHNITSVPYTKSTCSSEILAVIGFLYLRGLLGLNNHDVAILFCNLTGNPVFGATMSKSRFKYLFSNISFDDFKTRTQRWVYDRFTDIRDVFESFNHNCSSCVVPGDFLSLDETLYPMRTRIGFKQFNPNKSAKYGLLFKSINACRYPYTFRTAPYVGKPRNHSNQSSASFMFVGLKIHSKGL